MKISNRWFESDDAWDFHIANKNIWRRIIDGASIETQLTPAALAYQVGFVQETRR